MFRAYPHTAHTAAFEKVRRTIELATLIIALTALFLHMHRYSGIAHDGLLYTGQALRQWFPEALNNDLFFKFGSQDSFSWFPALYANVARVLGLANAAAVLTTVALIALVVCAGLLSRDLVEGRLSWLALAVLITIPGSYGSHFVFSYWETFVTPRPLAEALSLLAIWLAGRGIIWGTVISLGCALTLHPLLTTPAAITCLLLHSKAKHTGWIIGIGTACALMTWLVATHFPVGPIRLMDATWRSVVEWNTPYVLASQWFYVDWEVTVTPLISLAISMYVLPRGPGVAVARATLITSVAGLLLALWSDNIAPVVLMIQGQPWRWIWLAKVVAALLLAPTIRALWQRSFLGRSAGALLLLAWACAEESVGLPAALLGAMAVLLEYGSGGRNARTWILFLGLAITLTLVQFASDEWPRWLWVALALPPLYWAACVCSKPWIRIATLLASVATCGTELAHALDRARPSTEFALEYAAFEPWREQIPVDATVLFPGSTIAPWVLLNRKNYASLAAPVFSREAALEKKARADRLVAAVGDDAEWYMTAMTGLRVTPSAESATQVCNVTGIDFLILHRSIGVRRLATIAPAPYNDIFLYRCSDLAGLAAPNPDDQNAKPPRN